MSTTVEPPTQAGGTPDPRRADEDVRAAPGRRGALAGAVVGGLALGIAELFAGLFTSVPSLVTAVGQAFIPNTPGWLKDLAVNLFGTSDKLVLNAGVALTTLGVAAWAGVLAFRAPAAAGPVLAVLALVGGFAALQDTFASPVLVALALACSIGGGWVALRQLAMVDLERRRHEADADPARSAGDMAADGGDAAAPTRRAASLAGLARRRFLTMTAGIGVAGLATALGGRSLTLARERRFDQVTTSFSLPTPIRPVALPQPQHSFGLDGITPIVEASEDFYRIDTALVVPRVDPATWTLRITGMVDREIELTYDDLLNRDLIESYVTLSCVSNEVGGDLVGNARWLGFPLKALLEEAGIRDGAEQVVGRAVDGWTAGFPIEVALDGRDAMVAVGMNGERLPPAHGFPARLVVPGLYGYVSATKWLTNIELTTWDGFDGYWVPRGWAKEGPIKTQSRIDVPRPNAQVPVGPTTFGGIAWAVHRGISRVEVRAEGGEWVNAELSSPLSDDAWVQWKADIDVPEGWTLVEVRATDGNGDTQGEDYVPPRPDGAEGYHVIRVRGV